MDDFERLSKELESKCDECVELKDTLSERDEEINNLKSMINDMISIVDDTVKCVDKLDLKRDELYAVT